MDMNFSIERPRTQRRVQAFSFGCSPENPDNTDALQAAFDDMAAHPGTELIFAPGVYRFTQARRVTLRGARDACFDGNGAVFLFAAKGFFGFTNCERLCVRNCVIDWDWEGAYRLADMIRCVDHGEGWVEFEHFEVEEVQRIPWQTINQYDAQTLQPGCEDGKEYEINFFQPANRGIEYPGGNHSIVRHDGLLEEIRPGEVYCLRYEMYGTNAFNVCGGAHITFENVTVWSCPGMAFVVCDGVHHLRFSHCVVGKKPGANRNISATADSMHVCNTGGYVIVEDCDFSFAGDDAINIHDNVGLIVSREGEASCVAQTRLVCAVGDEIGFLRDDVFDVGFSAKLIAREDCGQGLQRLTFDRPLPEGCGPNWVTFNTRFATRNYIFRRNYFHENRARGLLLGASCGLVEDNVLYRTQGPAIWTVVDIEPRWSEGTGVRDLTVRRNRFIDCDVNHWSACVVMRTLLPAGPSDAPVFRDILYEDNWFEDTPSFFFSMASCADITLSRNTFALTRPRTHPLPERGAIHVDRASNVVIRDNVILRTPYYRGPLSRNRYPWQDKGVVHSTLTREPLTVWAEKTEGYTVSGTIVKNGIS